MPVKNWPDLDVALTEIEKDIRKIVIELITEEYIQEGRQFFKKRCYEQALDTYIYALRWAPMSAIANRLKGLALLELQRYDEALMAYEQTIHLEPEAASVYKERGDAFYHLKRYDEAISSYQAAIARKSDLVEAYSGMSKALYALAKVNLQQAQEYEEKAHMLLLLIEKDNQEDFE